MSVWLCIPSCRPAAETEDCLRRWRALGYKIALLRQGEPVEADLLIPTGEYLGWARSTNILAREVLRWDESASWIVGGGDDYLPDPARDAASIEADCFGYFYRLNVYFWNFHETGRRDWDIRTFGVMQPTGDRWGDSESARATYGPDRGAQLDRIAGSPWMGREWCERAYLGNGPMWDGYHHMFADEELQEVAIAQGVFWQRRDLCQMHNHFTREPGRVAAAAEIYSSEEWTRSNRIFCERKAKGFPGSGVIGCW